MGWGRREGVGRWRGGGLFGDLLLSMSGGDG